VTSKKKLQKQLQEEKRQRKYAERDATMWCDVVLEQEDDLDRKDVMIAVLGQEKREKQHELEERYAIGIEHNKLVAKLRAEIDELKAPKVRAWLNDKEAEVTSSKPKPPYTGYDLERDLYGQT